MANLKWRYLIVIILLTITATVVSALQYDSSQDRTAGTEFVELQKIPMQIGNWRGQDIPLDESVYEILETRAIIHRNYTDNQGHTVLLSIVYYHDTKVDFHAPEACLGGRGKETNKTVKKISLQANGQPIKLNVAVIKASNATGRGLSYYFYKTGGFMGQNYIKMRINLAKNKFFTGDKSGSLIRFSVAMDSLTSYESVEKQLTAFMQNIMQELI